MRTRINNLLASSNGEQVSINKDGRKHCVSMFCSALQNEDFIKSKNMTDEERSLQSFEKGVRKLLKK